MECSSSARGGSTTFPERIWPYLLSPATCSRRLLPDHRTWYVTQVIAPLQERNGAESVRSGIGALMEMLVLAWYASLSTLCDRTISRARASLLFYPVKELSAFFVMSYALGDDWIELCWHRTRNKGRAPSWPVLPLITPLSQVPFFDQHSSPGC